VVRGSDANVLPSGWTGESNREPSGGLVPLNRVTPLGHTEPMVTITMNEALDDLVDAVGGAAVYVPVPITSGRREVEFLLASGIRNSRDLRAQLGDRWAVEVYQANRCQAQQWVASVRERLPTEVVIDPSRLEVPNWTQDDYNGFWLGVIDDHVKRLVLSPEWMYSRGGRLEVGFAVFLGREIYDFDMNAVSDDQIASAARQPWVELADAGWSAAEINAYLPPFRVERPNLQSGPFHAAVDWLSNERCYQLNKFGIELDDVHTKAGIGPETWWWNQLHNYLYRAHVLGLDNVRGRQALAKFVATGMGLLESTVRVYGDLPAPGLTSGEVDAFE
jgi:hypothetical protein